MSDAHSNGSTTLPRGFRYHEPITPEPAITGDQTQPPSPPRQRLKVRRRNVSNLQATEQFLALVAAADIPLPTIEVPPESEDLEMLDYHKELSPELLAPRRHFSPPKTPVPAPSIEEEISQKPEWFMRSSRSQSDFIRPTSAQSNTSDLSDDSFYSGAFSRPSEDGSCTSPESDYADPFQFPILGGKGKEIMLDEPQEKPILNGKLRYKARINAPFTKAQSAHVWATYLMYLQDATVTPLRLGAARIPPEGVCHRVARQARRSWKGATATPRVRNARLHPPSYSGEENGSSTPTDKRPKVYAQWPHSQSATRNHLRELCRKCDPSSVSRVHRHWQSRSPTPFSKPHDCQSSEYKTFRTDDISVALGISTAESMKPDGPLAKLTRETPVENIVSSFPIEKKLRSRQSRSIASETRARRLGSPFSRTYGPSSSRYYEGTAVSLCGPSLGSPLRFDHSRSLNGTQKRRAQHELEEEIGPNGPIVRPSILNEQLFISSSVNSRRVRSRGFSLGDEALHHRTTLSVTESLPASLRIRNTQAQNGPNPLPSTFCDAPTRLGSPFSESGLNTFPRYLSHNKATIRNVNIHQTRRSIESFDFGEGPSLQSRLDLLSGKLKQIRERDTESKGS